MWPRDFLPPKITGSPAEAGATYSCSTETKGILHRSGAGKSNYHVGLSIWNSISYHSDLPGQIRYTRSSWRRFLLWQASTPKGFFSWDPIKQVVKTQGYKNEREHKCQTEGNISQLCRYARRVTKAAWRQRKVCQSDRISVGTLIYSIMSGWNICCYSPLTKLRWAKPVQTREWCKSHLATRKWTHTTGGIIVSRIQSAVFPLLSPCSRPQSVTHQSWKGTETDV